MKEGISAASVSFSVVAGAGVAAAAVLLGESIYHLKMALGVKFFSGNRIYMMKMEGQLTRHPVTPRHWGFSPYLIYLLLYEQDEQRKSRLIPLAQFKAPFPFPPPPPTPNQFPVNWL